MQTDGDLIFGALFLLWNCHRVRDTSRCLQLFAGERHRAIAATLNSSHTVQRVLPLNPFTVHRLKRAYDHTTHTSPSKVVENLKLHLQPRIQLHTCIGSQGFTEVPATSKVRLPSASTAMAYGTKNDNL